MALMSFLHAGWLGNLFDDTPKPPIEVPIDMSKAGVVADFVIRSDDSEKTRVFSLYFVNGTTGNYKTTNKEWLEKFVGHGDVIGTITPVKMTIYRLEKDKEPVVFYEGTIEAGGTHARGFELLDGRRMTYHNRTFKWISLPKGKYRIQLENLKDFPELKGIEMYLAISRGMHKI